MRVLVDTHTFLWWVTDDKKLSSLAHKIISNEKIKFIDYLSSKKATLFVH